MVAQNGEEEENLSASGNNGRSLWLRTVLAVIVSVIGATCGMYPSVVTFARGIGLSFVGFILPPILYLCAREGAGRGVEYTSSIMMALSSLIGFGLFNMATCNQGCNLGVTGTTPPCPYLTQHPVVGCTR
eukprot:scaffold31266_cov58-Attheya_sp.AAC.1